MIEAKNKGEFLQILNLISEEAVRLSKKSLNEAADPYVQKYSEQLKTDQKMYGSLSEQDEELPPLEDEPAGDEGGEEDLEPLEDEEGGGDEDVELEDLPDDEGEEGAEEEGGDEESPSAEAEEFGVSFDSVLDAINNLRAGKSLKDTNIKDQTSAYYDRLDEPERKVLLVFLKQLSEILGGALEGSEAKDPGDANLTVTDGAADEADEETEGEEGAEEVADEEGVEGEDEEVISDEEAAGDEEGTEETEPLEDEEAEGEATEEDTSPPIKVNEGQDLEELRRRVRRLMLRG